jgi:hypothetical protein
MMPQIPHGQVIGRPEGWTPETEEDHFTDCPICKQRVDMRDLGQVFDHWHGGPSSMTINGKHFYRRIFNWRLWWD